MAKGGRIKWSRYGFEDLRHEPRVKAEIEKYANMLAEKASQDGAVEGFVVTDLTAEEPRAAFSVMATGHAARHDRKHLTLLKALGEIVD